MGDIVSLKKARRRRERLEKDRHAAENRRKHGRKKGERLAEALEKKRRDEQLSAHKIEDADD